MVLEMRSWMHRVPGTQGVRKQVDFIKERGEINTEFLMLGDSSAPRLEDVLKGFFASCPHETSLESFLFSFIHLGLFVEDSSCNVSPLPVLQVGLFTAMCKHGAHTVPHKLLEKKQS